MFHSSRTMIAAVAAAATIVLTACGSTPTAPTATPIAPTTAPITAPAEAARPLFIDFYAPW